LKNTDKEDQGDAERDLGRDPQPEPEEEDGGQDQARHGIQALDVGVQDRRRRGAERKPDADHDSQQGADGEGKQRLDERDPKVAVNLAARKPGPEPRQHLERLAEEERRLVGVVEIDRWQQGRARGHVPQDHHKHEDQRLVDAQRPLVRR
jgi:hypothetical protein